MRWSAIGSRALAGMAVLVAGEASLARGDDSAAPPVGAATAAEDISSKPDATAPGETWRFRRHQGQWWYWLPSKKWVVWNGDQWGAPAAQVPTRSSSGSGNRYAYPPQQGNWGPVHYDRWGNREYPYSRRKSGLQQLGPVPAMGGVRSLPGWGGER